MHQSPVTHGFLRMEVMNKNEWASRREGQMEQVMQNMTGIMMVDNVRLETMTFK